MPEEVPAHPASSSRAVGAKKKSVNSTGLGCLLIVPAFAAATIGGAGLFGAISSPGRYVAQLRADLHGHSGLLLVDDCPGVIKDTGRGDHETFFRCRGSFVADGSPDRRPNVTVVEDLREPPPSNTIGVLVLPGDPTAYRPRFSGWLYVLSLAAIPLLLIGLLIRMLGLRWPAYTIMLLAAVLSAASEVGRQNLIGWN
jgi:hypothetical protein